MTILAGYIPTRVGEAVLGAAMEEAQLRGTRLVIVSSARGDAPLEKHRLDPHERQALEERLGGARIDFEILEVLRRQDPADAILDAAEKIEPQLLVIGLRKRSPVGKLIMGSTAQKILLEAPCNVLGVRVR